MEFTQESLTAAGFTAEQAKTLLETHKNTLTNNYIPKARFDEVNNSLTERDAQIATLKQYEGDNAGLKTKIADLEKANKEKDENFKKEKISDAMKAKLGDTAHDAALVLGQIDATKVSLGSDGNLIGFDEQIKSLKTAKAFLFKPEQDSSKDKDNPFGFFLKGTKPPDGGGTSGDKKTTKEEEFGVNLAKKRLEEKQAAEKASQLYFKN